MGWQRSKDLDHSGEGHDMQWHLMWCRRRQENAWMLVIQLPKVDRTLLRAIASGFRVTDSVMVEKRFAGFEIHAVLDEFGLLRDGLEQRLAVTCGSQTPQVGWARFPEDGLTMEALLENARSAIRPVSSTSSASPAGATVVNLRDFRPPSDDRREVIDA